MHIRELAVSGAYEITPVVHGDSRGEFLEWYRADMVTDSLGYSFDVRQANMSISSRGVLRGIHFADVPEGQAKYVTVPHGAVVDFVVDIRVGSPTFGSWDSVVLDDQSRKAIYIGEGLGHAFLALNDNTIVSYLVSDVYRPEREHTVNPLDAEIALAFPLPLDDILLSPKDASAPSLSEAQKAKLLPAMSAVHALYDEKKARQRRGEPGPSGGIE